jgi:hypothetical protein
MRRTPPLSRLYPWFVASTVGLTLTTWVGLRWSALYLNAQPILPLALSLALHWLLLTLSLRWGIATCRHFAAYDVADPRVRITHHFGVWRFGLGLAIVCSAQKAAGMAGPFAMTLSNAERLLYWFLVTVAIAFPVGLWTGYLWGTAMASVFAPTRRT